MLMLKKICRQFPLHELILADFEELEGNTFIRRGKVDKLLMSLDAMRDGVNGPLVHRTEVSVYY